MEWQDGLAAAIGYLLGSLCMLPRVAAWVSRLRILTAAIDRAWNVGQPAAKSMVKTELGSDVKLDAVLDQVSPHDAARVPRWRRVLDVVLDVVPVVGALRQIGKP